MSMITADSCRRSSVRLREHASPGGHPPGDEVNVQEGLRFDRIEYRALSFHPISVGSPHQSPVHKSAREGAGLVIDKLRDEQVGLDVRLIAALVGDEDVGGVVTQWV